MARIQKKTQCPGLEIRQNLETIFVDVLVETKCSYYIEDLKGRLTIYDISEPSQISLSALKDQEDYRDHRTCLQRYEDPENTEVIKRNIYSDPRPVLRFVWTGKDHLPEDKCRGTSENPWYVSVSGWEIMGNKVFDLAFFPCINTGQDLCEQRKEKPRDFADTRFLVGLKRHGFQSTLDGPRTLKELDLRLHDLFDMKRHQKIKLSSLRPDQSFTLEFGYIGEDGRTLKGRDPKQSFWLGCEPGTFFGDYWLRNGNRLFFLNQVYPIDLQGNFGLKDLDQKSKPSTSPVEEIQETWDDQISPISYCPNKLTFPKPVQTVSLRLDDPEEWPSL